MTFAQIKLLLEKTGFPVAYRFFDKPQKPPFICYLSPHSNNFAADGKVYAKTSHIQVELYTKIKDQKSEEKVEHAISSFFWQKTETFIESETIYQVIYEIEV